MIYACADAAALEQSSHSHSHITYPARCGMIDEDPFIILNKSILTPNTKEQFNKYLYVFLYWALTRIETAQCVKKNRRDFI